MDMERERVEMQIVANWCDKSLKSRNRWEERVEHGIREGRVGDGRLREAG
jgi:hypothetical protein